MAAIESNITVELPDGADISSFLSIIEQIHTELNGLQTRINVVEVDDLISMSPIGHIREISN